MEAGASAIIDPADPDARKSLLANTGGMFSAIDFVGAEKAQPSASLCFTKADACSWSACSAGRLIFSGDLAAQSGERGGCVHRDAPDFGSSWLWPATARSNRPRSRRDGSKRRDNTWTTSVPAASWPRCPDCMNEMGGMAHAKLRSSRSSRRQLNSR